jgi:hypothetical protein
MAMGIICSECKPVDFRRSYPTLGDEYTSVSEEVLQSDKLTLTAKGLWCYMLSQLDDWKFTMDELLSLPTYSKQEIKKSIKELEAVGLLVRKRLRDSRGFAGVQYIVYDRFPEK